MIDEVLQVPVVKKVQKFVEVPQTLMVVWVVGVLPSAWIVQLTLPMWIGVCTSYAHDFALCNPAR